uniref:Structural maintenance of chromosomes protein 5 n=1 Tax=Strigamia maritima TaxID=126957 RepID=T1IJX8_STRMM
MTSSTSDNESVHGSIVRIKLNSFLTYDSIEFKPGPKLNVIIGPNGSGKSTIVCAICLGLGGKTKTIGRAGNVAEYIKHGYNKAQIEIELKNTKGRNFVVWREIRKDNQSTWMLNREPTSLKNIEDLMASLKIQINNLCQFLPQDRVADFVKMTKQELLENTEKAVGDEEMVKRHKDLIKLQNDIAHLNTNFESNLQRLENEIQTNARLEEKVQNYKDRELYMNIIEVLNQKKPWVEYEISRKLFNDMKNRKRELETELKQLKAKAEPFQKKIEETKRNVKNLEEKVILVVSRTIEESTRKSNNTLNLMDNFRSDIRDAEEDFKEKKLIEARREEKLESLKKHLDSLKNELMALPAESDIQPQIDDVMSKIKVCTRDMIQIDSEINSENNERNRLEQEVRGMEQEMKQLKDVHRQRVETLRQRDTPAYKAAMWLRDNKDKFTQNIHEPMMTLINVHNPAMAIYVESHISFDDMCAFVCEDRDDMNKFLKLLRDDQRLSVSAVLAPNKAPHTFLPDHKLEDFWKYGFRSYLRELFTAPDPVMSYLCQQYRVHSVPVGDEKTKGMGQDVENQTPFRHFYSSNHYHNISRSKYTGYTLSSIREIRQPQFLKNTFNVERVNMLQDNLQKTRELISEISTRCADLLERKQTIEGRIEELKTQKRDLVAKRDSRQMFIAKIYQKEESIRVCEGEVVNLEVEEEKMTKRIENILLKKLSTLQKLHEEQKTVVDLSIKKLKLSVQCSVAVELKFKAEKGHQQLHTDLEDKKNQVDNFDSELKKTKENARELLNKARQKTGLRHNQELPNEFKELFAKYPSTIHEINALIYENQAKADGLLQTDGNVIHEYNQRKKEIEKLKKSTENQQQDVSHLKRQIEELKAAWLPEIEALIQKIDVNFGRFFKSLGCVGEVSLKKGENNEEEFDKYAISLKVKYRDSEQLRELSAHEHSGGERSVGTILYMMALQELTRVPFRCVDEINQGMDSTNERKVFELLVQISCRESTAQYFLLTPKVSIH